MLVISTYLANVLSLVYLLLHFFCEWMCANKLLCLPHCPPPVGDCFVTVAVGDQMANWALCHVTSLHRGTSQSAQARLLNCCPHKHHSPILTESIFRSPEGLFNRFTECLVTTDTAWSHWFIYILSTWMVGRMCVCVWVLDLLPCSLMLKTLLKFHVLLMLLLADTSSILQSQLDCRCWLCISELCLKLLHLWQMAITLKLPSSCQKGWCWVFGC